MALLLITMAALVEVRGQLTHAVKCILPAYASERSKDVILQHLRFAIYGGFATTSRLLTQNSVLLSTPVEGT